MKRRKKNLDGVTSELLADKGVRSLAVTGIKILGWTVVGGLAVWGITAAAKAISKKIKANKEQRELEQQVENHRSMIVNPPEFFTNAVRTLQQAMQTSEGYKDTYASWGNSSYDKDKILSVLKKLQNKYEWDELVLKFGRIDGHDLKDWIGLDNEGDVKQYNLVLSNMQVDEFNLVPNVKLRFSLWGAPLPNPIM